MLENMQLKYFILSVWLMGQLWPLSVNKSTTTSVLLISISYILQPGLGTFFPITREYRGEFADSNNPKGFWIPLLLFNIFWYVPHSAYRMPQHACFSVVIIMAGIYFFVRNRYVFMVNTMKSDKSLKPEKSLSAPKWTTHWWSHVALSRE